MSRRALLSLGAIAAIVTVAGTAAPSGARVRRDDPRPNIVLVMSDDQTLAQFQATIFGDLFHHRDEWTRFSNFIVTTPVCCPSRATLLTGEYAHNHGARSNLPGYPDLLEKQNILPNWLRDSGYFTAHVGKYLNSYTLGVRPKATPPPGWDEWRSLISPQYFGYPYSINGRARVANETSASNVTSFVNRQALKVIDQRIPEPQPLYLQVDHYAPHATGEADPAGRCGHKAAIPVGIDDDKLTDLPVPDPPSINEDVSDKPRYLRLRPELSPEQLAEEARAYRCAAASLLAVDRGLERIRERIAQLGELDNTAFIFTSDNGYFYGEHRMYTTKYAAYEEAVHLPLAIRYPPSMLTRPVVKRSNAAVANIDLAPTILDLADAVPCYESCRVLDGLSLAPLMRSAAADSDWPDPRPLGVEFQDQRGHVGTALPCEYRAVRVDREVFIENLSQAVAAPWTCEDEVALEHYDLASDPYQLDNLYPPSGGQAPSDRQLELRRLALELSDCAGIEGRDPAPSSGHYCG